MKYTKQNFKDGQVLKAEHLNKIEDGLVDLTEELEKSTIPSDGTPGQVLTMGSDGNPIWADATGGADIPKAEGVEF